MKDYNSIQKQAIEYRDKQSYGKTVAKRLLLSNRTSLAYDLSRAKGASRGKAAANAVLETYGLKRTDYMKAKSARIDDLRTVNA